MNAPIQPTIPGQPTTPGQPAYPWQNDAWAALLARLSANRMPHGLLLKGPAGLGKSAFAQQLARAVLCQGQVKSQTTQVRPCGECPACQQFGAGAHPDYHNITLLEDKKDIGVDQIRELNQQLTLSSAGYERWRVAVIDPADRMNNAASNALLKTLEEPGRNTLLILVTAHPTRLLATLRSRCQQVAFPVPDTDTVLPWLTHHGEAQEEGVEQDDWPELLKLAGGAPLAALQMAQSDLPAERQRLAEQLVSMMQAMTSRGAEPVTVAAQWLKLGADDVLGWFIGWLMDLVQYRMAPGTARLRNPDLHENLQKAAKGLDLEAVHRYIAAVQRSRRLLETNVNDQLLLEALLVCWAGGLKSDDLAYLPE